MLKRRLVLCLLVIWSGASLWAQSEQIGVSMPRSIKYTKIPFTLVNHLIVIPVTINNQITLQFIVDTGANAPILTERVFGDVIGLTYDRSIIITGPGLVDSITAFVASKIKLELPGGVTGKNMAMLVLEDDYIELKKNLGAEIYGILGYDLFSRFVVELDYDNLEMTLHDPRRFRPGKRFIEMPMYMEGTKPYINALVRQGMGMDTLRMMIDTGASHSLLIDLQESNKLYMPDKNIRAILGYGLGGEIPGSLARLDGLALGKYELNNLIASFPDEGMYNTSLKRGSRQGTIGGNVLHRFTVILDYHAQKAYFKKNKNFKQGFEYDMSGLTIGYFENPVRLEIIYVLPNSPAEESGLKAGDEIVSLNGNSLNNSDLSSIGRILRSKEGKLIRIKIARESGKPELHQFRLQRLI